MGTSEKAQSDPYPRYFLFLGTAGRFDRTPTRNGEISREKRQTQETAAQVPEAASGTRSL